MHSLDDKDNLWIAWINMETILGNLEGTVKKAIASGVSEKVYFRILEILIAKDNWDIALDFGRAMLRKFQDNLKVWEVYLKTIIRCRAVRPIPKSLEPK